MQNIEPKGSQKSNRAAPSPGEQPGARSSSRKDLYAGAEVKAGVTASTLQNTYQMIEREFEQKRKYSEKDWMAKNTQEKPQSFKKFKNDVRNWDIN